MNHFPHNRPILLTPCIRRLTAPNPGMMTGPGTNTYLVGNSELAVIDPGPNIPTHIDTILKTAADMSAPIRWILCTHSHHDHSPAAAPLREASGAVIIGQQARHSKNQDPTFQPDQHWEGGESLGNHEFTLQGIHTPGHASNHLCFYLKEEAVLFTGDHLMEGSTVVIAPPDGDMADYLHSLEKLKPLPLRHLAPAHGNLIEHPQDVIEGIIQHRLMREAKVLQCLNLHSPCDLKNLTKAVYDDVPLFLHPLAQHSLQAHLSKLQKENKAETRSGLWQAIHNG